MAQKNEEDKQEFLSDGCEKWSDLEEAHRAIKDPELAKALRRMSRNYRKPPKEENQPDFFTPKLADVSTKDDVSLMDIAVFGLGKKPRFEPIKHELKDATITIQGGTECGMATIFDYDIFLFMVSYLVHEMNDIKTRVEKGEDSYLPPRKIRPPVYELLKFCRREDGGSNYQYIKKALERLSTTKIKIEKNDGSKRRVGMFSLIGDFQILGETEKGTITNVSISIPEWVYDGIVRVDNPSVLTLSSDYFLLNTGYHRFLHRVARKCAGNSKWFMAIEELYERSGTSQQLRFFKRDIKRAISELDTNPLPDYSVKYEAKKTGDKVYFTYKGKEQNINNPDNKSVTVLDRQ
jgi:plasmid replication initiation protein